MLLVVLLHLQLRNRFYICRNQFLELVEIFWVEPLLKHQDIIVLSICDQDLVQPSQVLIVVCVHNPQDIHTVAFYLLDWVAVECKGLKVSEFLQFLRLLEILDIVAMQVESLELWEIEQVVINCGQIVV